MFYAFFLLLFSPDPVTNIIAARMALAEKAAFSATWAGLNAAHPRQSSAAQLRKRRKDSDLCNSILHPLLWSPSKRKPREVRVSMRKEDTTSTVVWGMV